MNQIISLHTPPPPQAVFPGSTTGTTAGRTRTAPSSTPSRPPPSPEQKKDRSERGPLSSKLIQGECLQFINRFKPRSKHIVPR